MTAIRTTICAAIAALAACSPPAQSGAPQAAAESAANVAANPPSAEALIGRWGDNGDCAKDIVINADGTFTSYTGGSGTWTLSGDILSMTAANGTFPVRVELLNDHTLLIGNPDGSIGTSQRC